MAGAQLIPEETNITFDDLCSIYLEEGSFAPPADLHGQLCGLLCAGNLLKTEDIINLATEQMMLDSALKEATQDKIIALYREAQAQLKSSDLDFCILLPDNSDPLSIRLESLTQWCHGFLTGYGLSGINQKDLSEEAQSILLDFTRIVKVDTSMDAMLESDSSEGDFVEVCEYVRMAALMLFNENNSPDDAESRAVMDMFSVDNNSIMH